MKQIIQKLWIFMAMLWISLSSSAYDFEVDGIRYDITSFTDLTVSASSLSEDVKSNLVIPETVEFKGKTLQITELGESFAEGNVQIETVCINANVPKISKHAFFGCMRLKSVDLPHTVEIGEGAFGKCESLKEINVSDKLIRIGKDAFLECKALEIFNLPKSMRYLEESAFQNCVKLNRVNIGNVRDISDMVFSGCVSLSVISLSPCLYKIGARAFEGTAFETFEIPNSVSSIGSGVFTNCSKLKSVTVGNGITFMPQCFIGCEALSYIRFEDGKSSISFAPGSGTYAHNSYGREQYICNGYFADTHIAQIYLGRNFENYTSSPTNWQDYFSNPFINVSTLKEEELGPLVSDLPAIVDKWNNRYGTFENCIGLKKIKLGKNLETISTSCFKNCSSLDSITLPNKLRIIPSHAFVGCTRLSFISFGYYCEEISASAFQGIETIRTIKFYAINPPKYTGTFSNAVYISSKIFVPVNTQSIYAETTPWSNFWDITEDTNLLAYFTQNRIIYEVLPDEEVQIIGLDLDDLSDIVIGETVMYGERSFLLSGIAENAFRNNNKIRSISLPDNIDILSDALFSDCSNLSVVNLPRQTLKLGSSTFMGCVKLEKIKIPKTIISIGSSCFRSCSSLKTIDLTDTEIADLPENLFYDCSSLSEIRLPVGLKTIANQTFYNCKNLLSIDLNSVQLIGDEALYGCQSISELNIPSSCSQISNGVFNGMTSLRTVRFESGGVIKIGHNGNLNVSSVITPFPNPSDVDERRTGFRNGYYEGLFYELPIEHLVINRDIELPKYYERTMGTPTSSYSTVYNDIVYYPPFYGLTNLKSLEIGENVSAICKNQIEAIVNAVPTTMEYTNFGKCDNIEVVVSDNPNAPIGGGFSQATYESASLFLPNGGADSYKSDDYWKKFAHISEATIIPIESISFESDEVTMDINDSKLLHPIINPSEASIKTLKWSSSKPSIVNVSEDGVITTSTREGEAIITASACDGTNLSASIKIIVQEGAGISDVLSDGRINISVENGRLYIRGKHDTDTVSVYNVQGQLVISTYENEIELSTKGIYIIKVGSICEKIIL